MKIRHFVVRDILAKAPRGADQRRTEFSRAKTLLITELGVELPVPISSFEVAPDIE